MRRRRPTDALVALLAEGLPAHERRLEQRSIQRLIQGWRAGADPRSDAPVSPIEVCRHLAVALDALARDIQRTGELRGEFVRRLAAAHSPAQCRQIMLAHAVELGASSSQRAGDRRAFKRWFGPDALADRAQLGIGRTERHMVTALRAMGRIAARAVGSADDPAALWRSLGIEDAVQPLLRWSGDPRVRTEAFHALAQSLRGLPPAAAAGTMQTATVGYVYRAALDASLDVWVQREALSLLHAIAPDQISGVLQRRLTLPQGSDDFFVRRRAVELAARSVEITPVGPALVERAAVDPSPHVRQAVADVLASMPEATVRAVWPRLGLHDTEPCVRAAALLQLAPLARCPGLLDEAIDWLARSLGGETLPFCLRAALKVVEDGAAGLEAAPHERWLARLLPEVERLHAEAAALPVRRWAAQTRERLWLRSQPHALALAECLGDAAQRAAPGGAAAAVRCPAEVDDDSAGRVLAVLAQRDYGLGLERRGATLHAWRGHRFGFRAWRLLHEWRHPSPDKRQAHRHTIGRLFRGTVRAPSAILAELAQTKVPGEPLQMATESGWRPYLPLVDELLSLLDERPADGPLRLFTAEGVTEVEAPVTLSARLAARATLTRRFAHYAGARNWVEDSAAHPNTYLRMLGELGFTCRFRVHAGTRADGAVTRFFSVTPFAALPLVDWGPRLENYFFSAYDNSLYDLAVFVAVGTAAFLGQHWWVNRRMRSAREGIPLVVGGWGTRGKSGTERLKAGMFNALGYSIVSKTSGCEAMFLYAKPYGEVREMFLFRPYDKATIWEQLNVVRLARKLGADVFLWECMALTPAFVRLMQRAWMRDDFATLTNTFPDHEDLQGPAGIDIPRVMTQFIPRGGVLLTTEEQMRPILQTAADEQGTRLKGVGWLESGLIAPDVLARFPYQEHPDNIALVTALAAELGIERDFALKAMADYVVPDLGVLKTFPPVRVATRWLEFSNGMSANERYGCLGNWIRLGFDRQDPEAEPGVMISTVVNNRADRIARSRVFAGVIAEDIRADVHVLIGSNLDGLSGYIREAWQAHVATLTLWPEQPLEGGPPAALQQLARRYRVVHSATQLEARLRVMLAGAGADESLVRFSGQPPALEQALAGSVPLAADVVRFHARDVAILGEYAALEQRCLSVPAASPDAALDADMRQRLTAWFDARIVIVEDYHASGDAVIGFVRDATPPGFRNRVMGIQNIKGTGLDFIYRWLAWEACARACAALGERDALLQRSGLVALGSFQEFGLLTEERIDETLRAARETSFGQHPQTRAEMEAIALRSAAAMQQVRERMNAVRTAGWLETVASAVEGVLDSTDAVRRRRRADRIYRDLVNRRIGEARAAVELQALTARQKGGWLLPIVQAALRHMLRRP